LLALTFQHSITSGPSAKAKLTKLLIFHRCLTLISSIYQLPFLGLPANHPFPTLAGALTHEATHGVQESCSKVKFCFSCPLNDTLAFLYASPESPCLNFISYLDSESAKENAMVHELASFSLTESSGLNEIADKFITSFSPAKHLAMTLRISILTLVSSVTQLSKSWPALFFVANCFLILKLGPCCPL
jgi:hypothetical protein